MPQPPECWNYNHGVPVLKEAKRRASPGSPQRSSDHGAGEMAQRLRALTVLPEVPSSNPSNHIGGSKLPVMRSDALFWCATVYLCIIINLWAGASRD